MALTHPKEAAMSMSTEPCAYAGRDPHGEHDHAACLDAIDGGRFGHDDENGDHDRALDHYRRMDAMACEGCGSRPGFACAPSCPIDGEAPTTGHCGACAQPIHLPAGATDWHHDATGQIDCDASCHHCAADDRTLVVVDPYGYLCAHTCANRGEYNQ